MSDAAPLRRPDKAEVNPGNGNPVEVQRVEGGTSMGIITSVNTTHGHRTVVVDTGEKEVVTSGDRVRQLTGQVGRQVLRDVGGGQRD